MKLHFDPMAVLIDDLDIFESIAGVTFEEAISTKGAGHRAAKGIYYLVMRQNDPEFNLDALKGLTLGQVLEVAEAFKDLEPNPTEGAVAP